ncbi:MAG TPA: long-chain-fatty-acid--CoA ligase [Xanthobacteraceae bacterium]|nr:long-chain-fatty-acid--CoA ligase [Xanthobacteraceae bacterium]
MDRIWLKHYPPGVPADIDPSQYRSAVALMDESFAKFRAAKGYSFMGKEFTFGKIDELSRALGGFLQSKNLPRGARVAIMMPNVVQYPVAIAAILRAGYVVVNVNPLYTPRELEHQLNDSGAEAVIILENFAHVLQQVIARTSVKHVVVASLGDMLGLKGKIVNFVVRKVKKLVPAFSLPDAVSFHAAIAAGRKHGLNPVDIKPDDVAFLQYTGGTTGISKGATLLHRNIVANVLQNDAWLQPAIQKAPKDEQFIVVTALPLYHIFALTACFFLALRTGGMCILIPNPRDLPALIAEVSKYKISSFPAVNTLYNGLLHHPDFGKIDFSHLRAANGGGMAVTRAVAENWFKRTGAPIIEGYGLSETSPTLTCNRADNTEYTGTIGLPVPSTEIVIRDDEGKDVALGEPGEICARGPQVMSGYWNRPDETAKVMTKDGFFRTGDIGIMDAKGQIKIVDRKKDMVLVSGFNVYPTEIEDVVSTHPGVLECAVVGVPDAASGEAVKLFVVKKDPNLTEDAIRKFCAEQLTGYKRPKFIEFRTELPKTNVGKILRRALREEAGRGAQKAA